MTTSSLDRRTALQVGGVAALSATAFAQPILASAKKKKKKVLFFTKSSGYQHGVVRRQGDKLAFAERVLIGYGKTHGFEVQATKDGRIFDKDLGEYSAIVFYTTGDLTRVGGDKAPAMSKKGKSALIDWVKAGNGFVGSHCASDTFHTKGNSRKNQKTKDPYIAMLGGEFITHGRQQKAIMRVADGKFPGMKPAGSMFTMHEEWYCLKNFAADMHVLLVNETKGMRGRDYQRAAYPATWARAHGKGRVFYTSMGHRNDVWTNPIFASIFVGGIQWAIGDLKADVTPNIEKVTPKASILP